MGGIDREYQHRPIYVGSTNVAHVKKWYKKACMGVAYFSLLQTFASWKSSVNEQNAVDRGEQNTEGRGEHGIGTRLK